MRIVGQLNSRCVSIRLGFDAMIDWPSIVASTVMRTRLLPQIYWIEVANVMVSSLLAVTSQSQPSSVASHFSVVSVTIVPIWGVATTANVASD